MSNIFMDYFLHRKNPHDQISLILNNNFKFICLTYVIMVHIIATSLYRINFEKRTTE